MTVEAYLVIEDDGYEVMRVSLGGRFQLHSSLLDHAKGLSARERQVLDLIAQGHTNREMADKLGISRRTVETYRALLMRKYAAKNRAELLAKAMAS